MQYSIKCIISLSAFLIVVYDDDGCKKNEMCATSSFNYYLLGKKSTEETKEISNEL